MSAPALDERWWAWRGGGAWARNRRRGAATGPRLAASTALDDAQVLYGSGRDIAASGRAPGFDGLLRRRLARARLRRLLGLRARRRGRRRGDGRGRAVGLGRRGADASSSRRPAAGPPTSTGRRAIDSGTFLASNGLLHETVRQRLHRGGRRIGMQESDPGRRRRGAPDRPRRRRRRPRRPATDRSRDPRALQILSTEHWSLLASRSLAYNEAFSRAGMFLSFLSASLIVIGFLIGATGSLVDRAPVAAILLLADLLSARDPRPAHRREWRGTPVRARHEPDPACLPGDRAGPRAVLRDAVPRRCSRRAGNAMATSPPTTRVLPNVVHGLTTTLGMVATIDTMIVGAIAGIAALGLGASLRDRVGRGARRLHRRLRRVPVGHANRVRAAGAGRPGSRRRTIARPDRARQPDRQSVPDFVVQAVEACRQPCGSGASASEVREGGGRGRVDRRIDDRRAVRRASPANRSGARRRSPRAGIARASSRPIRRGLATGHPPRPARSATARASTRGRPRAPRSSAGGMATPREHVRVTVTEPPR